MMSFEKVLELIKLRSLAKQKALSGNVKAIKKLRKELAREKQRNEKKVI